MTISAADRLTLQTARSIREDFLHQNAFHEVDTHTSLEKQYQMLKCILHFHKEALAAIEGGVEPVELFGLSVREKISRAKYVPESEKDKISKINEEITQQIKTVQAAAT